MTKDEVNVGLFDEVKRLQKENAKLTSALVRARNWGIKSRGYSALESHALAEWVDGGMEDSLPPLPSYYPKEKN